MKPLLILRGTLTPKAASEESVGPGCSVLTIVTCYSPAGSTISVNYMFLEQLFQSTDHLLNNPNKAVATFLVVDLATP